MQIKDIPVPEIYKESADFRTFLKWFDYALSKTQYDTANMMDLYDPLRCPKDLLWCLGDTMGYKYDDRLCAAFNRFAMVFFMSMIKYKGSKTGVTLAAEVNLKQKDINAYGEENQINYDRLEDTSIPVNSVFVESNVEDGYINVVYFTDEKPVDSCIEYVRPLGMYCFQHAGVRIDSMTKISVDARLANAKDSLGAIGATRVGHYTRNDYARLQHMQNEPKQQNNLKDVRAKAWARSSTTPVDSVPKQNAGYRALSSLQLANNEHIVKSLFSEPIFSLGKGPIVDTITTDDIKDPRYNLRYNRTADLASYRLPPTEDYPDGRPCGEPIVEEIGYLPVDTLDKDRKSTYIDPKPKVNGIMLEMGQRIIPSTPTGRITTEQGNKLNTEDDKHITTE